MSARFSRVFAFTGKQSCDEIMYMIDSDGNGDSDCNANCAAAWPPMLATDDAQASAPFSIIARDSDNTRQWAFRGLPLYMYTNDSAAGDVNGEGLNELWYGIL